ncbi:MAG: hypothetical protein ACR2GI_07135 [Thermomicrobiales bacterium]
MATSSHQSVAQQTVVRKRRAFPLFAVGAEFGAALAFGGVAAATRYLGGNEIGMVAGSIVMTLAGLLALAPATRFGALLLTWNGLGIGVALFTIGIFSVGALMAFPLVLIAIAMSSWPRAEGESIASGPAIVALIGGFLLALLVYGVLTRMLAELLRGVGLSGD